MLGPSIILLGTSVGSGEFLIFPAFVQQYGLLLIWAAFVGFITQFVINI